MRTQRFRRAVRIMAPAREVFDWHGRPGILERLTPPWERLEVLERTGGIGIGARAVVRLGRFRIEAEHTGYVKNEMFRDEMRRGPFRRWVHTHRFHAEAPAVTLLEDDIEYALPLGWLGRLLGGALVRRRLKRAFAYRHRVTRNDLALHAGRAPLEVLVSGSHGLVGSLLVPFLRGGGHRVTRLVRVRSERGVFWEPATGWIEADELPAFDAVVHLAAANVAGGRWTAARKELIRQSRVQATHRLCRTLAAAPHRPRVLVCASAVGFYGDRDEESLDEASAPGTTFLAHVCSEWEEATRPAREAGIRVVNLRFGLVLSPAGGALRRMLPPFRLGLGGRIGGGRQYVSWIGVDDAVGAIHHALHDTRLAGPVNAVAPGVVTNADFARVLGRVLRRPAFVPMPAWAARAAFGELGNELLLAGAKVRPARLLESAYPFRHPELGACLRHVLGRET